MYLLDKIAETRIAEAVAAGELDDLPGMGRPLALDDDAMIPTHLRVAYRILNNSGYLPPEIKVYSEIHDVESLIGRIEDGASRAAAARRLALLRVRLGRERCDLLVGQGDYCQVLADRFADE